MGLACRFSQRSLKRGKPFHRTEVATLYFCKHGWAAVGALMTSYFIIPSFRFLGQPCWRYFESPRCDCGASAIEKQATNADTTTQSEPEVINNPPHKRQGWFSVYAAYLAPGVGGFLSLGLGVSYVHMLSIVAGNGVLCVRPNASGISFRFSDWGHFAKESDSYLAHACIHLDMPSFQGLSFATATSIWFWDMIPIISLVLRHTCGVPSSNARRFEEWFVR